MEFVLYVVRERLAINALFLNPKKLAKGRMLELRGLVKR